LFTKGCDWDKIHNTKPLDLFKRSGASASSRIIRLPKEQHHAPHHRLARKPWFFRRSFQEGRVFFINRGELTAT
jgi:hypothetical protein